MKKVIWLIVLLAFFSGLRILHITADAPSTLSWGRGPFTDEGFYAHNARNKILFDTWSMDDYNYHFVSPFMGAVNFTVFKMLGVKYKNIRLGAILFSILTLGLVFMALQRRYDFETALLAGFFMSFSYFWIMYNRLFISEIPMLFFLMLSWFFLRKGTAKDFFIAGMVFMLAVLSKSLALHFIAVITWILWRQRGNRVWQKTGLFLMGAGAIILVWLVLLVWPDPDKFFSFYRIYVARISPKQISQIYKVFNAEYFAYAPVLTTVTFIALRWYRSFSDLEKQAGIWLTAGILFLMLFSYTTTAYYLILFIPTVILAGVFMHKIRHQALVPIKGSYCFNGAWLFSAYFIFRYILIFYFRDAFFQSWLTKLLLEIVTVLIITGLWRLSAWLVYHQQRKVLIAIILLFLIIDFGPYLQWLSAPQYSTQEIMRDLQSKVRQGTVAGPWAPALCLETSLREFPFGEGIINTGKIKQKTSLTHLLLERREEELGFIQSKYASLLRGSKIVATYSVDNRLIDLWKLPHD